jgi:hypothetical protein
MRLEKSALLVVCLTWLGCASEQESSSKRQAVEGDALWAQLTALPGVTVEELAATTPGTRAFLLGIEQPVDHARPERGAFSQRALLLHRDVQRPLVLASTGYGLFALRARDTEVSYLLQANSLYLEHRFFEASTPEPADYNALTIRQAAEDHHRVVQLLKGVYPGRWLSTGVSKGGMTSLYHRRFFPRDVDGTIAYVAPQSYGTNDPRYPAFLEEVGTAECRTRIVDFQRAALSRRGELLPLYQRQAEDWGLTYEQVGGLDVAFEHAVQEFRFAFWQYGDAADCPALPGAEATAAALSATLDSSSGPADLASDQVLAFFGPYYYQAAAQLGSYGPLERHLQGLLAHRGTYRVQRYSPAPVDHFDIRAMPQVQAWLGLFGERVMLLYGAQDPWSAGAFALGQARDSYRYVVPGANHGTATITNLPEAQQTEALATIERWAGSPILGASAPGLTSSPQPTAPAELSDWTSERQPRRWWRATRR